MLILYFSRTGFGMLRRNCDLATFLTQNAQHSPRASTTSQTNSKEPKRRHGPSMTAQATTEQERVEQKPLFPDTEAQQRAE